MTPIEFVVFDGDSAPNQPVHEIAAAMHEDIEINGEDTRYRVLSYYYYMGKMVLDIEAVEG